MNIPEKFQAAQQTRPTPSGFAPVSINAVPNRDVLVPVTAAQLEIAIRTHKAAVQNPWAFAEFDRGSDLEQIDPEDDCYPLFVVMRRLFMAHGPVIALAARGRFDHLRAAIENGSLLDFLPPVSRNQIHGLDPDLIEAAARVECETVFGFEPTALIQFVVDAREARVPF